MFVKTVKVKKPNPIAAVIILAAVVILVIVWVISKSGGSIGKEYKMKNNTERIKFLEDLGWKVSDKEIDSKTIKIPQEFSAVYDAYNKLMKQQGFDLSEFKGKDVYIFTYEVYNYPDKPDNIVAHLIINNDVLVGGDVCSIEKDGFIHGLMPVNNKGMDNSENAPKANDLIGSDESKNENLQDSSSKSEVMPDTDISDTAESKTDENQNVSPNENQQDDNNSNSNTQNNAATEGEQPNTADNNADNTAENGQ